MKDYVAAELAAHGRVLEATTDSLQPLILAASSLLADCIAAGGKVLLFGNGGSAADAQHIASELVGRFVALRDGFAAMALTTDTSVLTSIGNDLGFDEVFARQVQALAGPDDALIAVSTSGNSPNVIEAVRAGAAKGCKVIGWTGKGGGALAPLCDVAIIVPSDDTQRIQEMHILIGHVLCGVIERRLQAP